MYYIKQWPGGDALYANWLGVRDTMRSGHDQEGLNMLLRGSTYRRDVE